VFGISNTTQEIFMKLLLAVVIALSFTFSHKAWSHGHDHEVKIATEILEKDYHELSDAEQKQLIKYLVDNVHHASEAEVEHQNKVVQFLLNFKNKFKFKTVGKQAYRWYSVMAKKYPGYALDLSLMFPLSHLIEMSLLPAFMSVAVAQGWGPVAKSIISVAGTTIMIPGLDPVCIGLGIMYTTTPPFRNAVRATRVFAFKIPKYIGLDHFMKWMVDSKDRYEFINEALSGNPGVYKYISSELRDGIVNYDIKVHENEKPILKMKFQREKASMFLDEITFDTEKILSLTKEETQRLKSQLKPFNWNVRDAIFNTITHLRKNDVKNFKGQYHVEHIHNELMNGKPATHVEFKHHSIIMKPKRQLSAKVKSFCNNTLRKFRI
jgi:hypothetical protein